MTNSANNIPAGEIVWSPSDSRIEQANITSFINRVNADYSARVSNYTELYQWSIKEASNFWQAIWDFCEIRASIPAAKISKIHENLIFD